MYACPKCSSSVPVNAVGDHITNAHVGKLRVMESWDCTTCGYVGLDFNDICKHCLEMNHPAGKVRKDDKSSILLQNLKQMQEATKNGRIQQQQKINNKEQPAKKQQQQQLLNRPYTYNNVMKSQQKTIGSIVNNNDGRPIQTPNPIVNKTAAKRGLNPIVSSSTKSSSSGDVQIIGIAPRRPQQQQQKKGSGNIIVRSSTPALQRPQSSCMTAGNGRGFDFSFRGKNSVVPSSPSINSDNKQRQLRKTQNTPIITPNPTSRRSSTAIGWNRDPRNGPPLSPNILSSSNNRQQSTSAAAAGFSFPNNNNRGRSNSTNYQSSSNLIKPSDVIRKSMTPEIKPHTPLTKPVLSLIYSSTPPVSSSSSSAAAVSTPSRRGRRSFPRATPPTIVPPPPPPPPPKESSSSSSSPFASSGNKNKRPFAASSSKRAPKAWEEAEAEVDEDDENQEDRKARKIDESPKERSEMDFKAGPAGGANAAVKVEPVDADEEGQNNKVGGDAGAAEIGANKLDSNDGNYDETNSTKSGGETVCFEADDADADADESSTEQETADLSKAPMMNPNNSIDEKSYDEVVVPPAFSSSTENFTANLTVGPGNDEDLLSESENSQDKDITDHPGSQSLNMAFSSQESARGIPAGGRGHPGNSLPKTSISPQRAVSGTDSSLVERSSLKNKATPCIKGSVSSSSSTISPPAGLPQLHFAVSAASNG